MPDYRDPPDAASAAMGALISRAAAAMAAALTLGILYFLRTRTQLYPNPSSIASLLVYGSIPIVVFSMMSSIYWPRMVTSKFLGRLPQRAFDAGGAPGRELRDDVTACCLDEWRFRSFHNAFSLAAGAVGEAIFYYLTGSILPLTFALLLLAFLVARFPSREGMDQTIDEWVERMYSPDREEVMRRSVVDGLLVASPVLVLFGIFLALSSGSSSSGPDLGILRHGVGGKVTSLQFSNDGKLLVSSGEGGELVVSLPASPSQVKVWDLDRRQAEMTIDEPHGVRTMAMSPDGKTIATSGWKGGLRLWDVATGKPSAALHPGDFWGLAFSPDGKSLASTAADGAVDLWDLATNDVRLRLTSKSSQPLAFSPDGKSLVVVGWGPARSVEVALVDPATGERRSGTSVDGGFWAHGLRFSPDGKSLAVCGNTGLWLHHVAGGSIEAPRRLGNWIQAESAAFSPDGDRLAVVALPNMTSYFDVFVLDVATGKILAQHTLGASESSGGLLSSRGSSWRGNARCVAISPDGKWLAAGGDTVTSSGRASGGIPAVGKAPPPGIPGIGGVPVGIERGGACIGLWTLVKR
jgi:hypothetical protein